MCPAEGGSRRATSLKLSDTCLLYVWGVYVGRPGTTNFGGNITWPHAGTCTLAGNVCDVLLCVNDDSIRRLNTIPLLPSNGALLVGPGSSVCDRTAASGVEVVIYGPAPLSHIPYDAQFGLLALGRCITVNGFGQVFWVRDC